jgi:hypothetical protein
VDEDNDDDGRKRSRADEPNGDVLHDGLHDGEELSVDDDCHEDDAHQSQRNRDAQEERGLLERVCMFSFFGLEHLLFDNFVGYVGC